jgi:hypothetical protein
MTPRPILICVVDSPILAGGPNDAALNLAGGDGDPHSLDQYGVQCHVQPDPLTLPYCNCSLTNGPFAGWPCKLIVICPFFSR